MDSEEETSAAAGKDSAAVADSASGVSKIRKTKKPQAPNEPDWREGYERAFRLSIYMFGAVFLVLGIADAAANVIQFADFKELAATGGTLAVAAGSGLGKSKSKKHRNDDDSEDLDS